MRKGDNAALSANANAKNCARNSKNQDFICFNCDQKCHYMADCWRSGGGKEYQGSCQRQWKGENLQKQTTNIAAKLESKEYTLFHQTWVMLQKKSTYLLSTMEQSLTPVPCFILAPTTCNLSILQKLITSVI